MERVGREGSWFCLMATPSRPTLPNMDVISKLLLDVFFARNLSAARKASRSSDPYWQQRASALGDRYLAKWNECTNRRRFKHRHLEILQVHPLLSIKPIGHDPRELFKLPPLFRRGFVDDEGMQIPQSPLNPEPTPVSDRKQTREKEEGRRLTERFSSRLLIETRSNPVSGR